MKVKTIPAPVLHAVSGLLSGYVEDAAPATIVKALTEYGTSGGGVQRKPADRCAVSIKEAASAWGVSDDTVRRLIKAGLLPSVRVGVQHRIPIEALSQCASQN
jgi:excisionase family DNA binding protein